MPARLVLRDAIAIFTQHTKNAAVWHEGRLDRDMKFVMRNCRFDGANGFILGRIR